MTGLRGGFVSSFFTINWIKIVILGKYMLAVAKTMKANPKMQREKKRIAMVSIAFISWLAFLQLQGARGWQCFVGILASIDCFR